MTDIVAFVESTGQAIGHGWGGWLGQFHAHQWAVLNTPWVPVGRTSHPGYPAWGSYEAIGNGTEAAALADLDNVFAALARPPDMALVSIAINGAFAVNFQVPAQPYAYTVVDPMTDLLIGIDQRAPGIPIIVTTMPVCVNTADQVNYSALWNRYLPRGANEARKAGANVWVADIWKSLNANRVPSLTAPSGYANSWLADGIHPNETGYERTYQDASAWFDAHRVELGL